MNCYPRIASWIAALHYVATFQGKVTEANAMVQAWRDGQKTYEDDAVVFCREWLRKDRVVALGEMGLDYHYDFSDRASQRRVFAEQLELAEEMGLPAVVHCREAFEDVLGIWRERGREDGGVVFHCFSGGCDEARAVLDGGGWISFTGTITFRNAGELQEVARYVPLERILLETDCPYLSPEPKRNVKPNEPALLVHTAEKLAELRGVPVEEIAQATVANSRSFFGIDS